MAVHEARGCRSTFLGPPHRALRRATRGTTRNFRCCECALARAAGFAPPLTPPARLSLAPLVALLLWLRLATRMKFAPARNRDDMPRGRRKALDTPAAGALGSQQLLSDVTSDRIDSPPAVLFSAELSQLYLLHGCAREGKNIPQKSYTETLVFRNQSPSYENYHRNLLGNRYICFRSVDGIFPGIVILQFNLPSTRRAFGVACIFILEQPLSLELAEKDIVTATINDPFRKKAFKMSARMRMGAGIARSFGRVAPVTDGRGAAGTGNVGARSGSGTRGRATGSANAQGRREFRALSRGVLRGSAKRGGVGGSRSALRQPRAACPAMLDLFLHVWDELDDS